MRRDRDIVVFYDPVLWLTLRAFKGEEIMLYRARSGEDRRVPIL